MQAANRECWIRLANGDTITNLGINGDNFVANAEIPESFFTDNCSPVVIFDGVNEVEHPNMELVQITKMGDDWWFVLRDIPDSEMAQREMEKSVHDNARRSAILFVLEAESDESRLDDETMNENSDVFIEWTENWTGKRSQIVRFQGILYKAIHDVLTPAQNLNPLMDTTNQIWKRIGNPGEEWPEWSRPIAGVDNPYMLGDKVTHLGSRWVSTIDDNWWEPGAYGWTEQS